MASNVSNLLKEKIVTPVANSVAAQVDSKVKNGIILRKFIGVQLGESNTGCQLIKIDLNKINVKDPSYEFTLYIKAFSQKGLFNFIVNVNKTDSLQVDVKCELKNSDSNNGEAIGYYDVDTVGNTITISLVKAFVVNTSINECKFVSTKDTLNISDLDIDWSDTGNVKTSTSINIRYNQTSIYEYDEYFHPYKPDFADGEMYQIAKFDFSEILNKALTGNKDFNISIDIIYHLIGEFHICFDLTWIRNMSMITMIRGAYEKIPFQSTMERKNFDELFKFCRKDNTTLLLLINPPAMYMSGGDFVIRRIEVHRADADIESDLVKIDVTPEKLVNSDGSLVIGSIQRHKASIPAPTDSEISNGYYLKADGTWGAASNEINILHTLDKNSILENEAYVLGKMNFSKLIDYGFESNPIIVIKVELTSAMVGNITLNFRVQWNATGNKIGISLTSIHTYYNAFTITDSEERISVLKTSKLDDTTIAICYNPDCLEAILGTKEYVIIHSFESYVQGETLKNIVSASWSLEKIDTTLNKLQNISTYDVDYYRVFQASDLKNVRNNGLVPHPTASEAENKYLLGADAKWHPRKAGNEYIANLKPTEEILRLTETDTTKGVSFVTIDFNTLSQKIVEATPSTYQEFRLDMKVLVKELGVVDISVNFSVTVTGVIACTGVTSNRGMDTDVTSFSITFGSKIGSIPSPGFFVNDYNTKIFKLAFYTVFANNGVKIIDAQITSYSDLIDENDIIFTWELGVLDKLPAQIGKSNEIYLGVDLPRDQTFRQMNIETPIAETEETTVEAEQLKYNGLVPAPGKYEVNNGYYLKADGTWDLPKNTVQNAIATVTPTDDMISQVEAAKTTKLISFLTIDVNEVASTIEKTERFTFSMDVLTCDFGLVRIGFTIIINTRGFSNISNFSSDLGTNMLPLQLTRIYNLKDYGVETMSPIFGISDATSNKGIFNIGINGSSMKGKVIVLNISCIPGQTTVEYKPFKYIFEPTLIDLDSSTTIQRFNSSLIGSMDPSNVFGPITEVTSGEIANETDPYELKMKKLRKNGLVPAPYQYEADNQYYLKADGSWDLPKRGNNNSVSVVTPSEEMTSQVSSTVGITFATFDYSKIIESLSLAVNTGSGFEGILIINTKLFGEILINFSVSLFNLNGTINKGATAYANVGTKSTGHHSQIASIQNTYGADIKTPVFIYTDSVNNICKIGLYGSASKSPVIIKDCTLNQTYSDFDVNDITITWEPTTITISEENTNDASLFTNMDWSKTFTPMTNMTDPDGSYSENNIRRWKLQNNGLVPAPTKYEADQGKVLRADGTWGYQKKPLNDMLATVSPSEENIEAYKAAKETKRISFVTIDFTNVMNKVSSVWSGKLHFDVSEFNFGTTHLYLQFLVNKTMCNVNIFSTLGTNPVDTSSTISDLMDYGVETSSPIFVTNEGDSKNIIRIGFNGVSATRNISILDCYIDSPYDITIDDLIISWESSIIDTTLVNRYINSKVISYMDSGDIFSSISNITSPSMIESTDAKTLKMYKLMYNGFVPAPYQYEADQGYVLYADGTWGPIKGIIRNRTFTVTPHTDSSSTQTNDYVITEGAEDLAIAINENYSVDINIVFSGLGTKNNTNTTLTITGVTGTVNLYDYSGNPIKYITDGMSMKCTIFKNTIDDPVESMNAYCIYDIISYPNTINGPSE